jgi:histone H3/H4
MTSEVTITISEPESHIAADKASSSTNSSISKQEEEEDNKPDHLVSPGNINKSSTAVASPQEHQQSQPNNQKLPSAVEFEPPVACVRRILKRSLPSSTNVGKDACAAFARACGIFIIYVTACSHDFARENKRQTITANDVLAAVKVCLYLFKMDGFR